MKTQVDLQKRNSVLEKENEELRKQNWLLNSLINRKIDQKHCFDIENDNIKDTNKNLLCEKVSLLLISD